MESSFKTIVECELCSEKFTDGTGIHSPRILLCCGNSYCTQCIESLLRWSHTCPICRSEELRGRNLWEFPVNRAIVSILEILCSACSEIKGSLACPGCREPLCEGCYEDHCSAELERTEARLKTIRAQQNRVVQRVCTWLLSMIHTNSSSNGGNTTRRMSAAETEITSLTLKQEALQEALCKFKGKNLVSLPTTD